jgi:hypothetical protein
MSLNLKPILEDSPKCSEIIFSDNTGNGANGYIGNLSTENLASSLLKVKVLCESGIQEYNIDVPLAKDIADGTDAYTVTDFEESNVLQAEYIVFFTPPNETLMAIDSGTKDLLVYGSEFTDFEDFNYVIINGTIYAVDSINIVEGNMFVTLKETYTGPTFDSELLIPGYSKVFYHAHVCTINKCLHSRIATVANDSCKCRDKSIAELTKALFLFFAIDVRMETYNYKSAQELIDYLKMFCGSNKGNCGC